MRTVTRLRPSSRLFVYAVVVLGFAGGLSSALASHTAAHYPTLSGGTWVRGPNLVDAEGRAQPRQEHAGVSLNGFVYLIGGFVPIQPPPEPSPSEPEPFPFQGTGEVLVYTPRGHRTAPAEQEGGWRTLPESSSFPEPQMHHIVAVRHRGKIWTFGGHAGGFEPTRGVFVFTPASPGSAEGSWRKLGLSLPTPRAAGAAVSLGNRIYVLGGVVPWRKSPDSVNRAIRTTSSVLVLDTTKSPLRWRRAPAMRQRREHFNAVVANGRIWVFHGRNEISTHMRGVESWAPGERRWRREENAPVGTSANILAAVRGCVYSFGGEFIASNVTGTLTASQVFHVRSRSWSRLRTRIQTSPLDASGADSKHGTFGVVFRESAVTKIMAPGGATTAWFDPSSKVHVFTPPARCTRTAAGGRRTGRES